MPEEIPERSRVQERTSGRMRVNDFTEKRAISKSAHCSIPKRPRIPEGEKTAIVQLRRGDYSDEDETSVHFVQRRELCGQRYM